MEDELLPTELPTSWREQYTFLKVFYGNVFFACLSFGLFTPWIHEYLDQTGATSSTAFPILMANSVGEILGALVFGVVAKRYSTKTALLACIFVGFLGCLLFLFSTLVHSALVPVTWLIMGRFLQGIWTGGEQTVEFAYVSDVVADADKLKVLSELGIASVAGFLFGPGLGMGMHVLGIHFGATFAYFPAAVHALCIAGVFVLTYMFFHELPLDCRLAGIIDRPLSKPNPIGLSVSLILMFVIMTSFAVCEHISKPLMTHDYEVIITAVQNEREDTYEVLVIALAVSVVAYLIVHWADGKFSDRSILHYAQILVAVGWFFTFDYEANILSYTSFIIGVTIGSFSIPICKMALLSMYSKILGPNPAGPYMGLLIAVGATAKAVEPLWSRSTFHISKLLCFGITCAGQVLSVLLAAVLGRHLCPHMDNQRMSIITLEGEEDAARVLPEETYEDVGTPSDRSDDSYMRDCVEPQKAISAPLHSLLLELPRPSK